jgi:hypothetical protein
VHCLLLGTARRAALGLTTQLLVPPCAGTSALHLPINFNGATALTACREENVPDKDAEPHPQHLAARWGKPNGQFFVPANNTSLRG